MAELTVSTNGVEPRACRPRMHAVLSRRNRLTSSQLFSRAVRRGTRAGTRTLVLHLLTAGEATQPSLPPRLGFVVSRAVGPAVTRNLVKRRLRQIARERLARLPGSAVLVVRALPAAGGASYEALGDDFDAALQRVLHKQGVPTGVET